MKLGTFALAIAALGGIAAAPAVQAQAQEQFIPLLATAPASSRRWAIHAPTASRTT